MDTANIQDRSRALLEGGAALEHDALGRLALGRDPTGAARALEAAAAVLDDRLDCADFRANLLLRAWRLHGRSGALPTALWDRVKRSLLALPYRDFAPDNRMTHRSENHRIAFLAAEHLVAESWPEEIFGHDRRPAAEHRLVTRNDIVDWTNWVGTYGAQEWDSSTYYAIDLVALLNIFDFAADAELRRRARWVLDHLVLDVALKTFAGVYGASHGRCYAGAVFSPAGESTADILPFFFGAGGFRADRTNARMLDPYLATTGYRPPAALGAVAESREPMTHRQRSRADDRYYPPLSVPAVKNLNLYHDINLVTRRTAQGMLCSVQDYAFEGEASQIQAWQATLGEGAMVFANHPEGREPDGRNERPGYWIGSARLPRVVQLENTLAALYAPQAGDAFPFAHAYFPEKAFQEVAAGAGWVAGRRGDGYVGLRCSAALAATTDGPWAGIERRAAPGASGWVCELSDREAAGSFADFVRSLSARPLSFDPATRTLTCGSARAGEIRLPWSGPILVNGKPGEFAGFARHDGPCAKSPFGSGATEVRCGGLAARLAL
jgi:hypothetical protein